MKLLFLLFACLFTYAGSFENRVNGYFNNVKDKKQSSIQNFNNLKMIYLDAILQEDDLKQFKILDKLLKSSSIIGLRASSSYKSEFARLKKKFANNEAEYKKSKQVKKIKNKKIKKSITKEVKSKNKSKNRPKRKTTNTFNKLIYLKKQNDKVYLKWTKKLSKNQIKHRIWQSSGFFYHIYDIENSHLAMKTREISLKNGVIKVGQYKDNTIRLVYMSKKKRKVVFYRKDKTVQMYFKTKKNTKKNIGKKIQKKVKKTIIPEYSITYKNKSFKNKVIIIDPGHGGKDPGALGRTLNGKKVREKDIVLKISKYLIVYLKEMGLKAYLTRGKDRFIELKNRTKIANDKNADLFLSIHVNATKNKKTQGIETYFLSPKSSNKSKKLALRENSLGVQSLNALSKNVLLNIVNRSKLLQSNKLAIDIQRNLLITTKINSYNIKDHGVRGGPFWVLVGARMPNVLVEVGYLTNKAEAKRLMSKKYQKTLAKGIARGIESYLEKN